MFLVKSWVSFCVFRNLGILCSQSRSTNQLLTMSNWENEIELPPKTSDIGYAYILKSDPVPIECDRETLMNILENEEEVEYVTTPDNDSFIPPGSDYETLVPVLKRNRIAIKSSINTALLYTVILGALMLFFGLTSDEGFWSDSFGKIYIMVFGIIPILNGLYELATIRKVDESNYQNEAVQIKFDYWIVQKKVVSIYLFTGVLVVITILQIVVGFADSIESAGLVKFQTRNGEVWRLLTCTMLHGNIIHILFNASAIYSIGWMTIRITSFWHFVLVFLVSGLTGSLFSLYLLPETTSVGASGGIMGLIGFILVMGIKLTSIPRRLVNQCSPLLYW